MTSRLLVLVAVFTVVGGGAAASSRAAAETAPAGCGTAGACPATAHQYVWHGLICATVPHAYAGIDTIEVRLGATSWLCHSSRTLPWHRAIVATTFWVGEVVDGALSDGSQVCSAYDRDWAYHWSGVDDGTVSATTRACSGSIIGGCDGVTEANGVCSTQARTAANGYFPTRAHPRENPFYADLPFDDVNDPVAFAERCQVIPWAYAPGFAGHCTDRQFSYMKNHWLRIVGPDGRTCYGQIEDAGPSHGHLYHDALYVFGAIDARPLQGGYNDTGIDVSPALNGCLGFAALDGDHDHVSWQFVAATSVPAGPWRRLITTRQVFAP